MKKLMVATGCTAMAAIVGCSDAQKSAESYGIIGGNDGPTATWMTTQLPWNTQGAHGADGRDVLAGAAGEVERRIGAYAF